MPRGPFDTLQAPPTGVALMTPSAGGAAAEAYNFLFGSYHDSALHGTHRRCAPRRLSDARRAATQSSYLELIDHLVRGRGYERSDR